MEKNFTKYPQNSANVDGTDKVSKPEEDKQIKKLKKKLKKKLERKLEKKLIRKLRKEKMAIENDASLSSNINDDGKSDQTKKQEKKSFFTEVKEKFIQAVPSICRTVAKTATAILCGWVLKCFEKRKVA